MASGRLSPALRDRLRSLIPGSRWVRVVLLRRFLAVTLVTLACALALLESRPDEQATVPALFATRDLAPGAVLRDADVRPGRLPEGAAPNGLLAEPTDIVGKVLAGGARRGEALTDVRIVGRQLTTLTVGTHSASAVGIRLADGELAELLHPGKRVDVVSIDPDLGEGAVLAEDAVVVSVRPHEPGDNSRLIVVALPGDIAPEVASASLVNDMTITLG
ncbi:SAF domain-containing protein [Actinoalloteichus hymeniacidonis]|uniref:SAF domain-containing protein n=1 Tax=Actinoalloteichus hymeniacidonis TaxID=340345 RepID=A0AAC9MWT2_9PSEU|nr:SAF domain-containing protein [Actinoalloteichus hymeniacidonis]AOS61484.1 hypothetical protein TL08_03255 [Actinoalloteichus hymeniacidonis]MBB5910509.1 Flp pilus assembly protein CpaB [Actinoalloteichus hymeniacidonis]